MQREVENDHQRCHHRQHEQRFLEPLRIASSYRTDDTRAYGKPDPATGDDDAERSAGHPREGVAYDGERRGEYGRHCHSGQEDKYPGDLWISGLEHQIGGDQHQDGSHQRHGKSGNRNQNAGDTDAPDQQPESEPERENIEGARLWNPLRDEVLNQPVPDTPRDTDGKPLLTPRQTRILQLVAAGSSDRDVARALGLSVRTVQTHLQHIYRALGVRSRTEALAHVRALSLGGAARPLTGMTAR